MYLSLLKQLVVGIFLCCMSSTNATSADEILGDFSRAMAEGKTTHVFDIDNDSFLVKRKDRFYTNGLRYSQQYTQSNEVQSRTYGWRLGQDLYTASSTQLRPASIKALDHPYAAWLYSGVFKETYQADGSHLKVGLDFGCIGPCAGGKTMQNGYHQVMQRKLARGWNTQVHNELGGVLPGLISHGLQGRFGNIHTDASGVATLRLGALNALPGQSTLHGYLRGEVRAVAYNATLQGGYFSSNNAHTVKPKSVTGEVELGVAWNKPPFAVRASIVKRASEILDFSNAAGSQKFMRLQFTYAP